MPQTITKGYKALLAEAEAAVKTLSVEEAQGLVGRDDTVGGALSAHRLSRLKPRPK